MIGLTGINLDFQYIGLKPGSQNPQRYLLKPKNPEAAMRARLLGEGEGRSSRSYECLELKMAGKSVSWLSEMVSCCGSKTSDCFTGRLNSKDRGFVDTKAGWWLCLNIFGMFTPKTWGR